MSRKYDAAGEYGTAVNALSAYLIPYPADTIVVSAIVPATCCGNDEDLDELRWGVDWCDFEYTLSAAATLTHDKGLSSEQSFLEQTLTRGQFLLRRFGCPAVTLGVFTDKLPNTRSLTKGHIDDEDLKDGRAVQKAQGTGLTVGKAPPKWRRHGAGLLRRFCPSWLCDAR